MKTKTLYKISFVNQDKIYEIYARRIEQADLYGFVAVEELVFGEQSLLVVDTAEERLQAEFAGVKRTFIPLHAVIRIDEVEKRGSAKILNLDSKAGPLMAITPPAVAGNPDKK